MALKTRKKPLKLHLSTDIVNLRRCHILGVISEVPVTTENLEDAGVGISPSPSSHSTCLFVHIYLFSSQANENRHKINQSLIPITTVLSDAVFLLEWIKIPWYLIRSNNQANIFCCFCFIHFFFLPLYLWVTITSSILLLDRRACNPWSLHSIRSISSLHLHESVYGNGGGSI